MILDKDFYVPQLYQETFFLAIYLMFQETDLFNLNYQGNKSLSKNFN